MRPCEVRTLVDIARLVGGAERIEFMGTQGFLCKKMGCKKPLGVEGYEDCWNENDGNSDETLADMERIRKRRRA